MKKAILFAVMAVGGCSGDSDGRAACVAAGGQCLLGGAPCANRGTQNCNPPDRNPPGGAFCCLPCPSGTQSNDAGTACQ